MVSKVRHIVKKNIKYLEISKHISQVFLTRKLLSTSIRMKKTIRQIIFSFSLFWNFHKLLKFIDLPIHFGLGDYELLRYSAQISGYNYNSNLFSYNLWLTMGLKKNIAIPFGFYFQTRILRSNYFASINRKSWQYYSFMIKNSYTKPASFNYPSLVSSFFLTTNFFSMLSDICTWNLRTKYKYNRSVGLSDQDLDFSVSTFNSLFDFYDYRYRAQYY